MTLLAVNMGGVVSRDYALTIAPVAPKITTKTLASGTKGKAYSQTIAVTGTPTITWSSEGLPSGLSITTSGEITGTPTESGTFTVKITATNAKKSAKKNLKLKILNNGNARTGTTAYSEVLDLNDDESDFTSEQESSSHNTSSVIMENVNYYLPDDVSEGTGEGFAVVYVLPSISVDVPGMYDFSVTLSGDVKSGAKLLWLANPDAKSDDDNIAEFYGADGEEINAVPEDRKINVSAWLNAGRVYNPAIAVKQ